MTENSQEEADRKEAPASGMDHEVGYCRPPKHTRWPKGVCGNPDRRRNRTPKPISEMIEEFFDEKIDITENGVTRRGTNLEAIITQLTQSMADKKGAAEVLQLYLTYLVNRSSRGKAH